MVSTYRLQTDELSTDLINAIKQAFPHKEIEIIVQDVQDETEYLLSSPANKEHLLRAIQNLESRTNLVEVQLDGL